MKFISRVRDLSRAFQWAHVQPAVIGICLLVTSFQAAAIEPYQEYRKRIESAQNLTALNDNMFGDSVSLFNGKTDFSNTDIDLPGNDVLPVQLNRHYSAELIVQNGSSYDSSLGGAGGWSVDVPYISGMFNMSVDWRNERCSVSMVPSVGGGAFQLTEVWQGNTVHIPGGSDRAMLGAGTQMPTDGVQRKWTTKERDAFSCIPMQWGLTGEGFLMQTSSGLRYYFDVAVKRYAGVMYKQLATGAPPTSFARNKTYILASKVVDRFGNSVHYEYNSKGNPTRIWSSDGREINLTYLNGQLDTATANGRSWKYQYGTVGGETRLSAVVLPDSSRWQYSYSNSLAIPYTPWDGGTSPNCAVQPPASGIAFTLTVTHPGGAVGTFDFTDQRHYRSGVHRSECQSRVTNSEYTYELSTPNFFDVMTLWRKSVSGPGLAQTLTWVYDYDQGYQGLWGTNGQAAPYPCTTCPTEKITTVTNPDQSKTKHHYGFQYALNEGRLLATDTLDSSGVVRRTEATTYLAEAEVAGQNFSPRYGTIYHGDDPSSAFVRPVVKNTITQDGVTFTSQVNKGCGGSAVYCVDIFARPTNQTRSSTLGYSRTDATTYWDQQSLWVLGQVASSTNVDTGLVESQTTYDTATALPISSYAFGKLKQTLGYYADGTVKTVADGGSNTTTLSTWKRGTPTSIQYADGTTASAVVDNNGWIISATNEAGFTTSYGYDAMGRLSSIAHPTGDAVAWNNTTLTFAPVASAEYGIAAGHWKKTVSTGNARTVAYYDAYWRPLVEESYDIADAAGTRSVNVKRYDKSGNLAFQSYPIASLTDYAAVTQGSRTTYDVLDRVTRVEQDSELGALATTTEYLSGFKTKVTNPRQQATTTSFKVYDQPSTDWPVAIVHPEGAYTDIVRDPFGKPTSLTRRNADNSQRVTRGYVYDGYQQLCRTQEPEIGDTFMGYDAAGNLTWSASGYVNSDVQVCADPSWVAVRRVDRTYDARNRLTNLVFPDGRGNQWWSYTPDGLPAAIYTDNATGGDQVVNSYSYNKRRLLTAEFASNLYTWSQVYTYNANGHLQGLTYPTNLYVDYAPNALGQPTKAGAYASGVSYYPNGGIKQFTYGNGIVHTMTQNARQLPARTTDAGVLDFDTRFDANGNVTDIYDLAQGSFYNRHMYYDGLDRLKDAGSWVFGGDAWHHFTYDALDNIKSWKLAGVKDYANYYYEPGRNRLTNIQDSTGASIVGLEYDLQGNLSNKNGQGYNFDYGNRLRGVAGKETYRYDGHGRRVMAAHSTQGNILSMYGQSGQLLYGEDFRASGRKASEYVYLNGSLVGIRERNIDTNAYSTKYQHTDALGSPVAVTNESGQVVDRTHYEPFGAAINKPNYQGPGYTGHVMDAATGLTYMQQRYYDPQIGRFLSRDPVTANPNTGANFNAYWYANNNPYRFTDPDGRAVVGLYSNDTDSLFMKDSSTGAWAFVQAESGGKPFGDPIPAGYYSILERAGKASYYRLERHDSNYGDDDTPEGRDELRLHGPGRTIGCVAVCTIPETNAIDRMLKSTRTGQVKVDDKSIKGRLTGAKETLKSYGTLRVLPTGSSLRYDAKSGRVSIQWSETGSRIKRSQTVCTVKDGSCK